MLSRRLVAIATALTVAWTALWPMVGAARLLATDEPVMLCHQAGMQVNPGEAPSQPGAPNERKQHCPLCVMGFYAAFDAPVVAPAPTHWAANVTLDAYCAPLPGGVEVQLPHSRAPPCEA